MITPNGVLIGCVLIVFGLVPGLYEGLMEGIVNFSHSLTSQVPQRQHRVEALHPPRRLAAFGAGLIVLTVALHLAGF